MTTLEEMNKLHQEGKTLREIARLHGVSAGKLSIDLKEAGFVVRSRNEANTLQKKGVSLGGIVKDSPEWRRRNVEAQLKLQKNKMDYVRAHKQSHGCAVCGERDWVVLDLHHLDEKHWKLRRKNSVGSVRTGGDTWRTLSYAEIEEELAKCQVLCSNCHRKETHRQRQAVESSNQP